MSLFQNSGQSPDRRNEETTKIIEMFIEHQSELELQDNEGHFLGHLIYMYHLKDRHKVIVTPKQLFWLRDLKEKYL